MPWNETNRVNERMKFVNRLLAGERMTDLCEEFGISRELGYRVKRRFEELGPAGLLDQTDLPPVATTRSQGAGLATLASSTSSGVGGGLRRRASR